MSMEDAGTNETEGDATKRIDNLSQLLSLLYICKKPEILLEAFRPEYDQTTINDVLLEKYRELLSNIGYAKDKVTRYPVFFKLFYPDASSGISFDEAFNHHVHAYLQDMDTLKNKLKTYVNHLRNDVSATASNSDEVSEYYSELNQKVSSSFGGTTKHRNPHVHHGSRFMDGAALRAENARKGREMFRVIFPNVDAGRAKTFLQEQEVEEQVASEEAKNHWVAMSQRNNEQMAGLVDTVVAASAGHLFQVLGMEEMVSSLKKKNPGITL